MSMILLHDQYDRLKLNNVGAICRVACGLYHAYDVIASSVRMCIPVYTAFDCNQANLRRFVDF